MKQARVKQRSLGKGLKGLRDKLKKLKKQLKAMKEPEKQGSVTERGSTNK